MPGVLKAVAVSMCISTLLLFPWYAESLGSGFFRAPYTQGASFCAAALKCGQRCTLIVNWAAMLLDVKENIYLFSLKCGLIHVVKFM